MSAKNKDRDAALAAGRNKYQGAPCKHGHGGIRYVRNWLCVECSDRLRKNKGKPQ